MKHEYSGMGRGCVFGANQLSMNASTANPGEIQMKTIRKINLERCRNQFDLRINGFHFGQAPFPEIIKICGAGVDALVGNQFFKGKIKVEWHKRLQYQ